MTTCALPRAVPETERIARFELTLILVLLAAALLFVGLGAAPVTRSSEQRCLDTATDMYDGGSWVVPHMRGKPRLEKPPLYYWASAATGRVAGGLGPGTARIPSVLSGLALLLIVVAWGRSVGGFRAGIGAGVLLLTMASFVTLARRGDAEMMLAAAVAGALYVYDRIRYGGERKLLPVFAGLLTLGFLAKATAALMCIGVPIVVDLAVARRLRAALRPRVLAWIGVGLALGVAWYAAVLLSLPEGFEVMKQQLLLPVGGAQGAPNHVRPFWYYLPKLIEGAAPAVLVLPLAIAHAWRSRLYRDAPRTRFVAIAALATLVAFSALPQKQKHYILPVLAPLAVLLSVAVCSASAVPQRRWARAVAVIACVAGVGMAALVGGYVLRAPVWIWVLPAAIVAGRAVWLARRRAVPLRYAVVTYAAGALLLLASYHWAFQPLKDTLDTAGLAGVPDAQRADLTTRLRESKPLRVLLHVTPPGVDPGQH